MNVYNHNSIFILGEEYKYYNSFITNVVYSKYNTVKLCLIALESFLTIDKKIQNINITTYSFI